MIIRLKDQADGYRTTVDSFDIGQEHLEIEVTHAPTTQTDEIAVEVMLASIDIDGTASTIVTIEAAGTGHGDFSRALWIKGVTPCQFSDTDIVLHYKKSRPHEASAMQVQRQAVYTYA